MPPEHGPSVPEPQGCLGWLVSDSSLSHKPLDRGSMKLKTGTWGTGSKDKLPSWTLDPSKKEEGGHTSSCSKAPGEGWSPLGPMAPSIALYPIYYALARVCFQGLPLDSELLERKGAIK